MTTFCMTTHISGNYTCAGVNCASGLILSVAGIKKKGKKLAWEFRRWPKFGPSFQPNTKSNVIVIKEKLYKTKQLPLETATAYIDFDVFLFFVVVPLLCYEMRMKAKYSS